jgi:ATP-dependent DNA helicase PIF1
MDVDEIKNICIFSPKNEHVNFLNEQILNKIITGEEFVYKSIDSVVCDDPEESVHFPTEYFNSLTPSGMPPHELKLKLGATVMLLRNLNSANGQCNGTRAIIRGSINYF